MDLYISVIMKDNFSIQPDKYAKYRPSYPDELFDFIKKIRTGSKNAWDCGTGNGQVAEKLAPMFENIYATDISKAQIETAIKVENIHYSVQPAEETNFNPTFSTW
jgi:methylase of polypeptide subunit release factors